MAGKEVYYGPGGEGPYIREFGVKDAPDGTLRVPVTKIAIDSLDQISAAEITAGTGTTVRLMTPADVVALIAAHESA